MNDPAIGTEGNAALLLLVRELSGGMASLREANAKQADDTHAVKIALAEIKTKLEPLATLSPEIADMRTSVALHTQQLQELKRAEDDHEIRLVALEGAQSRRAGWEGPLGKIGMVAAGAIVTALVVALLSVVGVRDAKAESPRTDIAANQKCWAAPAKAPPKHLYL